MLELLSWNIRRIFFQRSQITCFTRDLSKGVRIVRFLLTNEALSLHQITWEHENGTCGPLLSYFLRLNIVLSPFLGPNSRRIILLSVIKQSLSQHILEVESREETILCRFASSSYMQLKSIPSLAKESKANFLNVFIIVTYFTYVPSVVRRYLEVCRGGSILDNRTQALSW